MILALDDASVVACVKMMPLGSPVVPDECSSMSGLSAATTTAGWFAGWAPIQAS